MNAMDVNAANAGRWMLGDVTMNRIGFGALRLIGSAGFAPGPPSDREQSIRVLRRAVELGVDHIDTAAFYFSPLRSANELINRALAPYPDDLVIATKVGPSRSASGEWLPMAAPEQLRGQVEENLRQLGRDHVDVVNLRLLSGQASIAEHFGALAELRDAGLIRHLGISNVNADHLAEALTIAPVVCVQNRYGIDRHRANDDLVRVCGEQGIAYVPFFAIAGSGRDSGPVEGDSEQVSEVARAHGVSSAQVRLAWTMNKGPHMLAIPGTSSLTHLEDNVAAGALRLSPQEMELLDSVEQ